jgi:hypothetical protein
MPGSPEWAAWDLASGEKNAAIHPDGLGAVSSDGSTFAVVHDLERDDSRSKQPMAVRRRGRQRTFALPPSMQGGTLASGRAVFKRPMDRIAGR